MAFMPQRIQVRLRGIVQGVGFRPFVYHLALRLKLVGWVLNDSSGLVTEVGDIVTQIDSKPTKGLKLHEMADRIRGAVGSEVELLVSRRGQMEPITLNLVRREILFHKHRASCE